MSTQTEQKIVMMTGELATVLNNIYKYELTARGYSPDTTYVPPNELLEIMHSMLEKKLEVLNFYEERFRNSGDTVMLSTVSAWKSEVIQSISVTVPEADSEINLGKLASFVTKAYDGLEGAHIIHWDSKTVGTVLGAGAFAGEAVIKVLQGDLSAAYVSLVMSSAAVVAGAAVAALGGTAAFTVATVMIISAGIVAIKDDVNTWLEDNFPLIFDRELDEVDDHERYVISAIASSISETGSALLPQLNDYIAFGTEASETLVTDSGLLPDARSFIYGDGGDDTILGGPTSTNFLKGGEGNDYLSGGIKDDILIGNEDDDRLNGGKGSDELDGGQGFDSYFFVSSDFDPANPSTDRIIDSDGRGWIFLDGLALNLSTFERQSGSVWKNERGFSATINRFGPSMTLTLTHLESGSRIIVENWTNEALGITLPGLGELGTPENPGTPLTDLDDVWSPATENDFINRDLENILTYDGDNNIYGSLGNDFLNGGFGDDSISAGSGDDLVEGGPGDDKIRGFTGNDIILDTGRVVYHNPGSFTTPDAASVIAELNNITSGIINNYYSAGAGYSAGIYGGSVSDARGLLNALNLYTTGLSQNYWQITDDILNERNLSAPSLTSGNDVIDAGDGSDAVFAGDGNDIIDGGDGNDLLIGAHDNDTIEGGNGDDLILGDLVYEVRDDLEETDNVRQNGVFALFSQGAYAPANANANGHDTLTGGAGNDEIYGGGGSDVIYGGEDDDVIHGDDQVADRPGMIYGNDTLYGDEGNDEIYGGAGNDKIWGGTGDDFLQGDYNNSGTESLPGSAQGDDEMHGGDGDDSLVGMGGKDRLYGDAGNDLIIGDHSSLALEEHGADNLYGGDGDDQISGQGGNDFIDGGSGADLILGGTGDDIIIGGAGTDHIAGNEDNDRIWGGADNDQIRGNEGDDVLYGDSGDDQLQGDEGNDQLSGGDGNDILFGNLGNDILDGGDGNDLMAGNEGDDLFDGGFGNDTLDGGEGNDTMRGGAGDDALDGDAGNDWLAGGDGNDSLYGGAGGDSLYGDAGNDVLNGAEGDDVLEGGAGNDTLWGMEGDDILDGGAGDDVLIGGEGANVYKFSLEGGHDVIKAGPASGSYVEIAAGIRPEDLVLTFVPDYRYYGYSGPALSISNPGYTASLLIEDFKPSDNSTVSTIRFSDGTVLDYQGIFQQINAGYLAGTSSEYIGSDLDDVVQGRSGTDDILGNGGNDTLYGNDGNDNILGGDGNDLIEGGRDDDFLMGQNGDDTIRGGDGDDWIDGGAGSDILDGRDGDDHLEGGSVWDDFTDVDTFIGGRGNDTLFGNNGADIYIYNRGDGSDLIADNGYLPEHGIDTLRFGEGISLSDLQFYRTGTNDLGTEISSESDLVILINGGPEQIRIGGFFGSDPGNGGGYRFEIEQIEFADGSGLNRDQILEQVQIWGVPDTQIGSSGNDIFVVDHRRDIVVDDYTDDHDTVRASVSVALGANLDDIELTGVFDIEAYGNSRNNVITGNVGHNVIRAGDGNDTLDGGAGDDTLEGGRGSDTYLLARGGGADRVIDWAAAGSNDIDSIRVAEGIASSEVTLSRQGNDLIVAIGGSRDRITVRDHFVLLDGERRNAIEQIVFADGTVWNPIEIDTPPPQEIIGTDGNNTLTGTAANDVIRGLGGNDSLRGLDGEDVLDGGLGKDRLEGGNGNDTLIGGEGNDILDGGLGADTLIGGAGNDNYYVDDLGDTITELSGEGTDTVRTSISYGLSDHLENLILTGSDAINGTGNTLNNRITGNPADNLLNGDDGNDTLIGNEGNDTLIGGRGNDRLNGGLGADVMAGGTGNDTYDVDDLGDTITELSSEGTDTVRASISYGLGNHLENLILTGSNAIDGTGNALNNRITGNAADNTLSGGAGKDTLIGGAGNDILIGGTGNDSLNGGDGSDTYVFNLGDGQDVLTDNSLAEFHDRLLFGDGITQSMLSFSTAGNDRVVSISGSTDKVTIKNWQLGSAHQLESIQLSDGTLLDFSGNVIDAPASPVAVSW